MKNEHRDLMKLSRSLKFAVILISLSVSLWSNRLQLWAHGSMEDPLSRIYGCFLEGPENLQSAACQAAKDLAGTSQFYNWMGINQLANGDHKAVVPDGQLCSGGKTDFRGMDLARTDWKSQAIAPDANGNYTFVYYATAPHSTAYFDFYVTRDGYDPSKPLAWGDLEATPFCHITSVSLSNWRYHMTCPLPAKSGKHVIYAVWQRNDSTESFYSCSDVTFATTGATPTATGTPATATPTPLATATRTPSPLPPTVTGTPQPTATFDPAVTCQISYEIVTDWGTGFTPMSSSPTQAAALEHLVGGLDISRQSGDHRCGMALFRKVANSDSQSVNWN